MTEIVSGWAQGFTTLLSPLVLAACVLGLVSGIVAGFLPCLSPAGSLALQAPVAALIWLTFGVQSPVVFVVAFAYGTLYGRALAAINQNAPNPADSASLPKDRRHILFSSLVASIVVTAAVSVGITSFGREITMQLGPAEMVSLMVFLLLGGAAFSRGSAASALAMVVLGLLLGLVGTDIETGEARLTFGISALEDGIGATSVALGLFVIANVVDDLTRTSSSESSTAVAPARAAHGFWSATILAVLAGFLPTNGRTFATTASAARSRPAASLFDPAGQGSVTEILRAAMLSDIRLSASLVPVFLLLLPVDAVTPFLRNLINFQALMMGGNNMMANLNPIAWVVFATLILGHVVPLIIVMRLAGGPMAADYHQCAHHRSAFGRGRLLWGVAIARRERPSPRLHHARLRPRRVRHDPCRLRSQPDVLCIRDRRAVGRKYPPQFSHRPRRPHDVHATAHLGGFFVCRSLAVSDRTYAAPPAANLNPTVRSSVEKVVVGRPNLWS
jgi:putative tricarboxylic transport membrane protein